MNSFLERYSHRIVTLSDCGCMIWMGATTPKGYGLCKMDETTAGGRSKPSYAHRASLQADGKVVDGKLVRHRCDIPSCVNPAHLMVGSNLENSRDMVDRGRSLKGSRQPNAMMADGNIAEIRARRAAGETIASIARDFSVHVETVRKAAHGQTWRHVQ